ncbi:hypothetical protein KL939_000119 [Ogataea angusta]|nr:hypothetical protein KL939_000119 [Ogataea angusta]
MSGMVRPRPVEVLVIVDEEVDERQDPHAAADHHVVVHRVFFHRFVRREHAQHQHERRPQTRDPAHDRRQHLAEVERSGPEHRAARGESEQGRSAPRDVVSGHSEREKSVGGRRAGKTQTADHQRHHGSKNDGPDRHSEPFVDHLDDAREWQPVVSGKRPDLSGKRGQNRRRTQPLANRRERHDTDGPLFPQGVVADLSKREAGLGVEHSSNVRLHAGHQAQHARPAAKCTNPDCADDAKRNSVRCVLGFLGHVHRRVECADRPDSRHPRKTELPAGAPVRVALDVAENELGVSSAKVRLGRSDRQSHQKDEHHQRVGDSRHRLQGGHVTAAHTSSDGSHDHACSKNRVRSALCHVEVAVFLDHHDG